MSNCTHRQPADSPASSAWGPCSPDTCTTPYHFPGHSWCADTTNGGRWTTDWCGGFAISRCCGCSGSSACPLSPTRPLRHVIYKQRLFNVSLCRSYVTDGLNCVIDKGRLIIGYTHFEVFQIVDNARQQRVPSHWNCHVRYGFCESGEYRIWNTHNFIELKINWLHWFDIGKYNSNSIERSILMCVFDENVWFLNTQELYIEQDSFKYVTLYK